MNIFQLIKFKKKKSFKDISGRKEGYSPLPTHPPPTVGVDGGMSLYDPASVEASRSNKCITAVT